MSKARKDGQQKRNRGNLVKRLKMIESNRVILQKLKKES